MSEVKLQAPVLVSESTTITIVGAMSYTLSDSRELPTYSTMSYTLPTENIGPSQPLNDGAVKIGNSLLNARVPENAFLRDGSEDL